MKITTLMENTTIDESLVCEHGLSLYIETAGHKILFDAGQSGAIIENAAKLGVDLSEVDIAVLSHGHYDHGNGFVRFLEINDKAKIYMNVRAFEEHLNKKDRYIGVDISLKDSDRIIYTGDEFEIDKGITLFSCNDRSLKYPIDSAGLSVVKDNVKRPDDFRHEHYLLLEEDRRVLISGCSHKGILNIETWFEPDILIGGFHFMGIEPDEMGTHRLQEAAKELMDYDTYYLTGHCTGQEQYDIMKAVMGERLGYISTGTVFDTDDLKLPRI